MSRSLKMGDNGPDVADLQTMLNKLGFPVNAVDGVFGPSTKAAVKLFQLSKGFISDGIVGPITQAALGIVPSPVPVPVPVPHPVPSTQLHGIDVSGYDPHTDWGLVAKADISFAFIKATEGYSYVNPYFATDWRASKAAGILRGAYHFFRPADDGVKQAKHMLDVMGAGAGDLDMLRPVLDWEVSDGVSAARQKSEAKAFCDYVKSIIGVDCALYYSASWPDGLGNMSEFAHNPKWIAQYGPRCRIPFDIWQYTDKAHVNGVKTPVDGSVFNGTLEEFKARFVVSAARS